MELEVKTTAANKVLNMEEDKTVGEVEPAMQVVQDQDGGSAPIRCMLCNREFGRRSSLNRHMRSIHKVEPEIQKKSKVGAMRPHLSMSTHPSTTSTQPSTTSTQPSMSTHLSMSTVLPVKDFDAWGIALEYTLGKNLKSSQEEEEARLKKHFGKRIPTEEELHSAVRSYKSSPIRFHLCNLLTDEKTAYGSLVDGLEKELTPLMARDFLELELLVWNKCGLHYIRQVSLEEFQKGVSVQCQELTQLLVFINRDLKAMLTTFIEQGRPYLFTEPGMASRPDTPLFPSSSGGYQMVDLAEIARFFVEIAYLRLQRDREIEDLKSKVSQLKAEIQKEREERDKEMLDLKSRLDKMENVVAKLSGLDKDARH